MMTVNDDTRIVNKLEASLTDDTRVIIYDHHMFIVQATSFRPSGGRKWQHTLVLMNDVYNFLNTTVY